MAEKSQVFAGVEVLRASGRLRRQFVYAALDENQNLLALGHGDFDEVLAYLGGQQRAVAAINCPRQLNTGAVNDRTIYQDVLPFEEKPRRMNARLCERLLDDQGLAIGTTPNKLESCPAWMKAGFDVYHRLSDFGYHPYPSEEGQLLDLETHAEGIFWRLLSGKRALPESLEGRLQRQLILSDHHMPVPDAMNFFLEITRFKLIHGELPDEDIHSYEELNALAAAFIAWQAWHHPDEIDLVGDPEEGQIALPKLN